MSRAEDEARALAWLRKQGPTRLSIAPEHSAVCLASLIAAIRSETLESAALACKAAGAKLNSDIGHQIAGHFADAVRALNGGRK